MQQAPGERLQLPTQLVAPEPPQESGTRTRVGHARIGIRKVLNLHDVPVARVKGREGAERRGERRQAVKGSRRRAVNFKRFSPGLAQFAEFRPGPVVPAGTRHLAWHAPRGRITPRNPAARHVDCRKGPARGMTVAGTAARTLRELSACRTTVTTHGARGAHGQTARTPPPLRSHGRPVPWSPRPTSPSTTTAAWTPAVRPRPPGGGQGRRHPAAHGPRQRHLGCVSGSEEAMEFPRLSRPGEGAVPRPRRAGAGSRLARRQRSPGRAAFCPCGPAAPDELITSTSLARTYASRWPSWIS